MIKKTYRSLMALFILAGLLISQVGRAATIDIDLFDFFASPSVSVSSASSAIIAEDGSFPFVGLLANDPFFGDPEVILAASNRSLFFDYDFSEGASNDDQFFVFVIDPLTGLSLGSGFDFFTNSSSSGTVSFDLTSLVGLIDLGLQFQLTSFDNSLDSTVEISNVRLVDVTIPSPAPLPLILIGILALMKKNSRGRKKSGSC